MSFIIGPKEKQHPDNEGEYHCCDPTLGGRTPAEIHLTQGLPNDVIENPVNTWITIQGFGAVEGSIFFTICCKDVVSLNVQNAVNPDETVEVLVNDEVIFSDLDISEHFVDEGIDIPAAYETATGNELISSPCGWKMEIRFLNEWIFTLNI